MVTWFLLLPQLVTLVSFLILIFPSPITSLLSFVHVCTTSMIFVTHALFLTLIWLTPSAVTSFVHSRLDYCNLMNYCLPQRQLNCLQIIQNALPILTILSNRCNGSTYRNALKVISTTYKLLQSSSPRHLCDLITVQPSRSTRSSTLATLLRPSVDSCLKITNCSFQYAAPQLWNKLPPTLHVPSLSVQSFIITQLFSIIIL